jgi:DNA polymerase/3'-5' exonuclease PolX
MLTESFKQFYKKSLLSEGGNVFKDENGLPQTTRIKQEYVDSTIKNVEKLTGLTGLLDSKLGSTGKKPTSGDIDLVIDSTKINKDAFFEKLKNNTKLQKQLGSNFVKKTGIEIAFKAPIIGEEGKFVQVDFMFTDHPEFLKFYYANNEGQDSVHKGSDRNILLSAVAKTKGLKLSMKGLLNRETNQLIENGTDPITVIKTVLGEDATFVDILNFESVERYLKTHIDKETFDAIIDEATRGINALNPKN